MAIHFDREEVKETKVLPAIEDTYAHPDREPMLRVVDWDGVPLDPTDAEARRTILELIGLARDGLGALAPPRD